MFSIIKWIWNKAQRYGEERVLALIHSRAEYHRLMSETAYLKQKHEPDNDDGLMRRFERPRYTPQEHDAISGMLRALIADYHKMYEHEDQK